MKRNELRTGAMIVWVQSFVTRWLSRTASATSPRRRTENGISAVPAAAAAGLEPRQLAHEAIALT